MKAFYQRYPYPKVSIVEYDRNLHDHFRYLARSCGDNPAPKNGTKIGRMLIAGCGTTEAVLWGASLPHFKIDAVDLSEASIEISKQLAKQLNITNVTFRCADFEKGEGLDGPYDFISSFGVLHHLEDPERGLAQLENVLKPGGLMALMVYSKQNRELLQRTQRMVSLLTKATDEPDPETTAHAICEHGITQPSLLTQVFKTGLNDYAHNREQFADTLLNPREVAYTIGTLVDFLKSAELEIVSPAMPAAWRPLDLLPRQLIGAYLKLSITEQMEIADSLTAPLFWVLAQRTNEVRPARPCTQDDALFWERVIMPMDTGYWTVEKLVPSSVPVTLEPNMRPLEGDLVQIYRQEKYPQVFHRIAWRVVQGFDGKHTLGEICASAAAAEGTPFEMVRDALRKFCVRLIDEMALGTPDASKCAKCPSQCNGEN